MIVPYSLLYLLRSGTSLRLKAFLVSSCWTRGPRHLAFSPKSQTLPMLHGDWRYTQSNKTQIYILQTCFQYYQRLTFYSKQKNISNSKIQNLGHSIAAVNHVRGNCTTKQDMPNNWGSKWLTKIWKFSLWAKPANPIHKPIL